MSTPTNQLSILRCFAVPSSYSSIMTHPFYTSDFSILPFSKYPTQLLPVPFHLLHFPSEEQPIDPIPAPTHTHHTLPLRSRTIPTQYTFPCLNIVRRIHVDQTGIMPAQRGGWHPCIAVDPLDARVSLSDMVSSLVLE
jgi:hypothetical protein